MNVSQLEAQEMELTNTQRAIEAVDQLLPSSPELFVFPLVWWRSTEDRAEQMLLKMGKSGYILGPSTPQWLFFLPLSWLMR